MHRVDRPGGTVLFGNIIGVLYLALSALGTLVMLTAFALTWIAPHVGVH